MNKNIINQAKELCKGKGQLLYLVKFGSHLYGTNIEHSDSDYKGVFLPHKDDLLLQKKCNSVHSNTSKEHVKNTSEDVDINLWSLQYWMELLKKGDTNAIDLLYAHTHKECVIWDQFTFWYKKVMEACYKARNSALGRGNALEFLEDVQGAYEVYKNQICPTVNPEKFINIKDNRAYIQYAYQQAKKYGLKGSRMDILEKVRDFVKEELDKTRLLPIFFGDKILPKLTNFVEYPVKDDKFATIIPSIIKNFECQYVKMGTTRDGRELLYILGKGFEGTITVEEAYRRLDNAWNEYGERARQAKDNEGVDWKAISHALRCIYQVQEIIKTGSLKFPLKRASELLEVKSGKMPWVECEKLISDGLESVGEALENVQSNNEMNKVHEAFILSFYK